MKSTVQNSRADRDLSGDCYQIAEQSRRIGDNKQAIEWYKKTVQQPQARSDIILLSEYALQGLGDNYHLPKETKEARRREQLEKLVEKLKNPSRSGSAASELGDMAKAGAITDPEIIDSIIAGLQSPDKDVRWYTAGSVLKWIRDPRVIQPLVKVMLEDKDDGPRWAAAEALTIVGDFTVVEPFMQAISDTYENVAQNAIEGLERLTNHSFFIDGKANSRPNESQLKQSVEKWRVLWEENKSLSQEQWIIEGFKKRGYKFKSLTDRENASHLINALKSKKWHVRYYANEYLNKITGKNFEGGGP